MSVLSVGFGNYVARERVTAIVATDSAPIRRIVQEARREGDLIDATQGRKTKSVVFMDDGRLVLSGLGAETLAKRMNTPPAEATDADME